MKDQQRNSHSAGRGPKNDDSPHVYHRRSRCCLAAILAAFCVPTVAVFAPVASLAATSYSGTIQADTTWSPENGPYLLSWVEIAPGATLTVLPGTVIKTESSISASGTLNIEGTEENPIYITSKRDGSVGGDTSGGWGAASPGDWGKISILPGGRGTVSHAHVRYGGKVATSGITWGQAPMLENAGGTLTVDNSTFQESYGYGINHSGGDTTVTRTILSNIPMYAVTGSGSGNFTLTDNIFENENAGYIDVNGGLILSHAQNTATGTGRKTFEIAGIMNGNQTWGRDDIPTSGWFSIPTGKTLTLLPGAVMKISEIELGGTLDVQGTEEAPVIFTSGNDDTAGGDSNGNGAATTPVPGDWDKITILPGGTASFDHAVIRYAGWAYWTPQIRAALYNTGGTLSVSNSVIWDSAGDGVLQTSGITTIYYSSFRNSAYHGVANTAPNTLDARNNYWGAVSGPYHPTLNPAGTGVSVSNNVDFIPWLTADSTIVSVDTDGDGLPNWYEDQYGLNKNDPADAQLDADGDGLTNHQEFILGTGPTDPTTQSGFLNVIPTTSLDFGSVTVGQSSTNQYFTVQNIGNAPLTGNCTINPAF